MHKMSTYASAKQSYSRETKPQSQKQQKTNMIQAICNSLLADITVRLAETTNELEFLGHSRPP